MDLICDVLRSAKGGFMRFHQRLHRIAAGPVLREAAAHGDPKARGTPCQGVAVRLWWVCYFLFVVSCGWFWYNIFCPNYRELTRRHNRITT